MCEGWKLRGLQRDLVEIITLQRSTVELITRLVVTCSLHERERERETLG